MREPIGFIEGEPFPSLEAGPAALVAEFGVSA
jgi:hypothetical protein